MSEENKSKSEPTAQSNPQSVDPQNEEGRGMGILPITGNSQVVITGGSVIITCDKDLVTKSDIAHPNGKPFREANHSEEAQIKTVTVKGSARLTSLTNGVFVFTVDDYRDVKVEIDCNTP